MSFSARLSQLINILNAQPINLSAAILERSITSIQTDSRILKSGELFLAFRGDKFDGHTFVRSAIAAGAIAGIVDNQYEVGELPLLQVEDTLKAYQQIGRWWRDRFNIPVIGVTGSVGKTTTKELISAVLGTKGRVLKTHANFNNEIGVPKTLLNLGSQHNYAVIEMAMRGRGQIAELTEIANPHIGVITNVGTAHIELLGSEQAIASAKCELLATMSSDSIAILNHDNPLLLKTAAKVWRGTKLTFGLEGGDIQGKLIDSKTVEVDKMRFKLPLPGRHNALNYMAALAVAKVLGIDWSTLQAGVTVDMPSGRSQQYKLPNDVVILDETYNAAPEAMTAALKLLAQTPGKRKIAVLGAMKELGEHSLSLHQQVGETVHQLKLDALLVLVDSKDAEAIAMNANGVPTECFATHKDLINRLKYFIRQGDRILFKAAHSVGLDKVVHRVRADLSIRK
ncbi:MAG: UDP-N-acetylmuramoyl-tripeptide--D-alanyl-D-alanine ligase [Cyanobacteria bacterium P01_A01_bin.84]